MRKKPRKSPEAKKQKIVFVGLSGGVDSAVSAALLKEEGYNVVGVFIKTWHPEFLKCNEEEERRDAMRVAAHLDIPFLTFDLHDAYKKEVADYMIEEYKKGRTPNPDVMCNKEVKFGAFLKKALEMGADYVATGHYARNVSGQNFSGFLRPSGRTFPVQNSVPKCFLYQGKDASKDQSYFLWTLRQDQLSKILFPVGDFTKTEVRKMADKFKLPVAQKKDSQGICFLGAINLKDFLKHYIEEKKGKVLNEKGEEIGFHDGVLFHTLGERHGFTITKKSPKEEPYYIVGKDIEKNFLVVSNNPYFESRAASCSTGGGKIVNIENCNWVSGAPSANKKYTVQIRYHGQFLSCKITCSTPSVAQVEFEKSVLVASGQSIVAYEDEVCLGGGVVI